MSLFVRLHKSDIEKNHQKDRPSSSHRQFKIVFPEKVTHAAMKYPEPQIFRLISLFWYLVCWFPILASLLFHSCIRTLVLFLFFGENNVFRISLVLHRYSLVNVLHVCLSHIWWPSSNLRYLDDTSFSSSCIVVVRSIFRSDDDVAFMAIMIFFL